MKLECNNSRIEDVVTFTLTGMELAELPPDAVVALTTTWREANSVSRRLEILARAARMLECLRYPNAGPRPPALPAAAEREKD
jgi:hypothetical protein